MIAAFGVSSVYQLNQFVDILVSDPSAHTPSAGGAIRFGCFPKDDW